VSVLTESIAEAWRQHLVSGHSSGAVPRDYIYASGRRSCVREMALDMLHPEDRDPFTEDTMERLKRGTEREVAIVSRLMQVGPRSNPEFSVVEGQKHFQILDRDGLKLITGKVDGMILWATRTKAVFEVKSGEGVRRITSLEEFDRSPYTRHMPDQLLAYMYSEGLENGFFILDRPDGQPRFIEVFLSENLERVESFLKDARQAVHAAKGEAEMPPFTTDHANCRKCSHFGKTCAPDVEFGKGIKIIDDERLVALADAREANKDAADTYDDADKQLKDALRGCDVVLLGGKYEARGTWQKSTTYNVPKEVKNQYAEINPQGRFKLEIERIVQ
jgi:hypothetical protein